MSKQQRERDDALENYANSIRWSIRDAIRGLSERQVRGGEFFCSAPMAELAPYTDLKMPILLNLEMQIEFNPPFWTRLFWEVEFVRFNRIELTAVYKAFCEE